MGTAFDPRSVVRECEHLGAAEVRARLEKGAFGSIQDERAMVARKWLAEKDQARETEQVATTLRAASAAERAADAAERAASAADVQARTAKKALITAIVAAIIAALALINSIWEPLKGTSSGGTTPTTRR